MKEKKEKNPNEYKVVRTYFNKLNGTICADIGKNTKDESNT